jgi:tetratricopeptide (TPR) repeat protein
MNIGWIMPFLGCALWAQGAASQDGEVGNGCADLNRRVIEQATTGQLREAETALAEAMGNSTNRQEPACGGLLLNNLATILYLSGRLAEAEVFAERSVSTLEPVLGPNTTGLLRPLHVLASARLEQGKIGKAREALTKMRRIPLERAEDRMLVHGAAAVLFHAEGRFTDSESEFRSALVAWERAGKPSGAEVASLLGGLASLYLSAERLDDAARVLDRALAALTTAPNAVPMDRIRLLQVRATLDLRKGNWHQAERDLEQAIALARGEPRSDAELPASMMTAYAQLLRKHHQRREARLVEQSARALRGHLATDNTVDVTELRRKSKFHNK